MSVLLAITVLVTVLTLVRNVAYWYRMARQPGRIRSERVAAAHSSRAVDDRHRARVELHYVIPAFQEIEALPATFHALRRAIEASTYDASITIVTSVHDEPRTPGEVRTRQIAERLCDGIPNARVIIDDAAVPSMAAAFNTGTRDVVARRGERDGPAWVAVYNADSTATPDSVQALGDTIIQKSFPEVLQLNHSSMRNLSDMRGVSGWYARGAAYYQTRWALGFEFDLHRRNSATHRAGPLGHSYHLKGHGLVLRLDTAHAADGFSTETPCEDLELGFRLAMQRVPVHSVPVLEDTESPLHAAAVTAQKRYWFSGMIDVLHFHQLEPELRRSQPGRFELSRLASLYRSAGCFLLAPVPYWFLVIAAVVLAQPWFALVPIVNAALSTWLIRRAVDALSSEEHPSLNPRTALADVLSVGIWSMTRNLGPMLYLVAMVCHRDRTGRMRRAHVAHIDESEGTRQKNA